MKFEDPPEDDTDDMVEVTRRVVAAWDKLPMPPREWMERIEKSAHNYSDWRRVLDPPGRIRDDTTEEVIVISEEQFDAMSFRQRVSFMVNIYKVLNRQADLN